MASQNQPFPEQIDQMHEIEDSTQEIWYTGDNIPLQVRRESETIRDDVSKLEEIMKQIFSMNLQINEQIGATNNEMKAIGKQNKQILRKVDSIGETKSDLNNLKAPIQSDCVRLNEEVEVLKSQQAKIEGKIKQILDFQADLNAKVSAIEAHILEKANQSNEDGAGKIDLNVKAIDDKAIELEEKIKAMDDQLRDFGLVTKQVSKDMEMMKSDQMKLEDRANKADEFQTQVLHQVHSNERIQMNMLEKANQLINDNQTKTDSEMKAINNKTVQLEVKIGEVQSQQSIFGYRANEQNKYKSHCFSWKISGIEELIKTYQISLITDGFDVPGYPFKAIAKFTLSYDTYAYVAVTFTDEGKKGEQIPLKVPPKVTCTLKGLNSTKGDIVRSYDSDFVSSLKVGQFDNEMQLGCKSLLTDSTYIVNNSIVIEIAIDPPSVTDAFSSNDGTLTVVIDNYKLRKQNEIDRFEWGQSSPYFYTSPDGFRVKVDMYLDAHFDDEGKGISAKIVFLSGENDSSLSRSFPHKTTVIVFNQLDSTKHYMKSVERDINNELHYLINLLPHDTIENDGFLKDDTLYYKVIIHPVLHI